MRDVAEIPHAVEVEWWYGKYSTVWHICKRREGRKYVSWTEIVSCDNILMPLTLTKTNRLKSETMCLLKQAYSARLQ